MTRSQTYRLPGSRSRAAFSLIEIIIVVGLLSIITLGLLLMFNQTQRVFRAGLTQVDVLEGGRNVTDMLNRELQQMRACYRGGVVNFDAQFPAALPNLQILPGNSAARTNVLGKMFFLTRENQTWKAIGYAVSDTGGGVGTLYRYEREVAVPQNPDSFIQFTNTPFNRMSRVMDGVVHFKVRTYNTNGQWITSAISPAQQNSVTRFSSFVPGEISLSRFFSNALPAAVDVEIGILEDRALRRARSIPASPDPTSRSNYLAQQAGKVHLFQIRAPIRNVDTAAYQ